MQRIGIRESMRTRSDSLINDRLKIVFNIFAIQGFSLMVPDSIYAKDRIPDASSK